MNGEQTRRIINVRVTNKNSEDYSDACGGKVFEFKAGQTVSIPLDAAHHIFGYNVKGADEKSMFDHVCKRWGWNTPENVKAHFADIREIWSKFEFTPVAVKMVEQAIIDTSALAENEEEFEASEQQEETPPSVPSLKLGKTSIKADKTAAA